MTLDNEAHNQQAESIFSRLNVVLVGLPGSGKSSLMDSLSIKPNYISLGDITRAEMDNNGPMAASLREKFRTTSSWSPEFVIQIIAPYLINAKKGFVLDGVPRKASEARELTKWAMLNKVRLDLLLHLEIDPRITLERILERDNKGRLETADHYKSRIETYLSEEEEMFAILKAHFSQFLTINTDNNPSGFAKNKLLRFVETSFKGL